MPATERNKPVTQEKKKTSKQKENHAVLILKNVSLFDQEVKQHQSPDY